MAEEQLEENKRIRPRERARGQKMPLELLVLQKKHEKVCRIKIKDSGCRHIMNKINNSYHFFRWLLRK